MVGIHHMKPFGMSFRADALAVVEDRRAEALENSPRGVTGAFGGVLRTMLPLLLGVLLTSPVMGWERNDVLLAIHQVENPTDTTLVGRRGELGPYQFRPVVWRKYTVKPFELAADAAEAQTVAEMHYDWIARGLARNGFEVSPYHIALAWNAGLQATVNSRTSRGSRHYAQRVANLVEQPTAPTPEVAAR
jgi:hypothetical protein